MSWTSFSYVQQMRKGRTDFLAPRNLFQDLLFLHTWKRHPWSRIHPDVFTFFMRLENYVKCGPNLYLIFSLSWSCWNHFVVKMKALNFFFSLKNFVCTSEILHKPIRSRWCPASLSAREAKIGFLPTLPKNKKAFLENKSMAPDSSHFAKWAEGSFPQLLTCRLIKASDE